MLGLKFGKHIIAFSIITKQFSELKMEDIFNNIYDFFFTGTKTEKGNRFFIFLIIILILSTIIGYLKAGSWKKYSQHMEKKKIERDASRTEYFKKVFPKRKKKK